MAYIRNKSPFRLVRLVSPFLGVLDSLRKHTNVKRKDYQANQKSGADSNVV